MSPIITSLASIGKQFGIGGAAGGYRFTGGEILNSNLGTTGFGLYYTEGVINSKRVQWFSYDTSASSVQSKLSGKIILNCYRITTDMAVGKVTNIPAGAFIETWGAAGNSSVPNVPSGWSGRYGGPGGYSKGTLTNAASQITIIVGQGGCGIAGTWGDNGYSFGGGGKAFEVRGGGFTGIFDGDINYSNYKVPVSDNPFGGGLSIATAQSKLIILAGGGGAAGSNYANASGGNYGGGGGGSSGGSASGYSGGGTGGTQSAGGSSGTGTYNKNGSAFLGGKGHYIGHGDASGGGGYYGGGGNTTSGAFVYPGAGGGSGYVSTSYLNSDRTTTAATSNQNAPPTTTSLYYFGNFGYSSFTQNSVPQPSDNYATYSGNHGMVAIIYP